MLFLNVPYAQMKVILVLIVFIDHKKRNLDTNECLFSVNEQQKVYKPGIIELYLCNFLIRLSSSARRFLLQRTEKRTAINFI